MASNRNMHSQTYASDPTTPNTTFVQADPSNFRAVVQKLTGAPEDPSAQNQKLLLNHKPHHHPITEMGPRKPTFKLHERRQATKKLELHIDHNQNQNQNQNHTTTFNNKHYSMPKLNFNTAGTGLNPFGPPSSSGPYARPMIFSPVSPLELYARGSPSTPREVEEEEEKAIAEKKFYLHPSPITTPRASDPPQLLPLFPLHSPTDNIHNSSS